MNTVGLVLFAVIAVTQDVCAQEGKLTPAGMLTFVYRLKATAGNYSEIDLTAAGVDLTKLNYIVFNTRGLGAAHVLLQKDRDVFDANVVELVIGGDGNTKSYIRDGQAGTDRATYTGQVISPTNFGTFWAKWNDTCIWVGRGDKVGQISMMSWCGLTYTLDYISAYFGAGSSGIFQFFKTATSVDYYCAYSNLVNYLRHDLFADGVDIRNTTSVVFATTGRNDAHILLRQDRDEYVNNAVEVILGASCNKKSMIRNVDGGSTIVSHNEVGILSPTKDRYFWISWANDCIQVGKGYIVGKDGFMEGCGLSLTINYISVSYGYGSDGYFTFTKTGSLKTTVP